MLTNVKLFCFLSAQAGQVKNVEIVENAYLTIKVENG